MSDSGKKTPSSPRKNLGTVLERSENDDISNPTGGIDNRSSVDSESASTKRIPGDNPGRETVQSSASSDSPEKDGTTKRKLHAQLSRSFFQSRSSSFSSSVDGCFSPSRHRLGTVAVEDPITHEKVVNSKVLLLYTGGALGWKVDPQGITHLSVTLERGRQGEGGGGG